MQGYLIPMGLVAMVTWMARPTWWATAMLAGGAMYAWDYLWGHMRVLDGKYGLKIAALGAAAIAVSFLLARELGATLAEFQEFANSMRRRQGWLYQLPAMGVGMAVYGLLVWSAAWARQRDG